MTHLPDRRLRAVVATSLMLLTGAVAAAVITPAAAHDAKAGAITLQYPWTRATAGRVGAGYTVIVNTGKAADTLISASAPAAATVEFHTMTMDGGVMRMRPLPAGIAIPAGGTAVLAPGGNHMMLIGLKAPLVQGTLVPVTLIFARAGAVKAMLKVEAAGAAAPASPHAQ